MDWHLSQYAVGVEDENAILLYHSLTGTLLHITGREKVVQMRDLLQQRTISLAEGVVQNDLIAKLQELQYLLPEGVREAELAKEKFKARYAQRDLQSYMVYVTNACNFRCVYCPQPHTEEFMSLDTMSQVCAAIEKQAVETPVSTIAISWFGGEPLLNLPVIVQGMSRLSAFCRAHQIALHAGMTTNGYGLTPSVFSKLMELGVTGFQITLDGMAETHDRNRVLRSGGGTWQTIWNHLLYMNSTKHDFRVSLRMNA